MVDLIESIVKEQCKFCGIFLTNDHAPCKEICEERETIADVVRTWLSSFDTSSATKCFEAVNILKERLEGEE